MLFTGLESGQPARMPGKAVAEVRCTILEAGKLVECGSKLARLAKLRERTTVLRGEVFLRRKARREI